MEGRRPVDASLARFAAMPACRPQLLGDQQVDRRIEAAGHTVAVAVAAGEDSLAVVVVGIVLVEAAGPVKRLLAKTLPYHKSKHQWN